ncbi:MAG: S8 family serine peptidase [Oligoflexia bacterium]|nr:S8 family serine peptidase [Oligoflexia bacterium]
MISMKSVIQILLLFLLLLPHAFATEYAVMVEFLKKPTLHELSSVRAAVPQSTLEIFDTLPSEYFERLYRLQFTGDEVFKEKVKKDLLKIGSIKKLEDIFPIEALSIKPSSSGQQATNDLFFAYQWGLKNQGQTIYRDLDDIHLEEIIGLPGSDIHWVTPQLRPSPSNTTIVAVLDSGVDLDHPDLKQSIALNSKECDGDKLPLKPESDKDGNGYIGDCMGWNFVSTKKEGDERPFDDSGHGTHIAGILAAQINNNIGIAGVSPSLKILPVKVLYQQDQGDRTSLATGTLSDRLAKGILYAIKRGAGVINLSLGWPLSLDTSYLRNSIAEALKRNIVVVAAAGNNNHSSPIFPCAYKGVICVGAITANGEMASFSNFGGHVDVTAPGDNILSTYPTKLTPDFFSVNGYEIKNGTSQAAPFVAAVAGMLKGQDPSLSNEEVYAKIVSSARGPNANHQQEKFTLKGVVNLELALSSLSDNSSPIVLPDFKDMPEVVIDDVAHAFSYPLTIKNFLAPAKNVEISVRAFVANQELKLASSKFIYPYLGSSDSRTLTLSGVIDDLDVDNTLRLEVSVTYANENHHYFSELKISRMPGFFSPTIISKEILPDSKLRPMIATVLDPHFLSSYPQYYMESKMREGEESRGLKINIFKTTSALLEAYQPLARTLQIPQANSLISVMFMDMNGDGQGDYIVTTICKQGESKFILYSYFNAKGELFSQIRFIPETVVLNYKKARYLPFKNAPAIPVWIDEGKIPALDLNPDPWEEDATLESKELKAKHLYYLAPTKTADGTTSFETRIVDNFAWDKRVRKQLSLDWNSDIELLDALPQSLQEKAEGVMKTILSIGKNYNKKYYIMELSTKKLPGFIASDRQAQQDYLYFRFLPLDNSGKHLEAAYLFPLLTTPAADNQAINTLLAVHENNTTVNLNYLDSVHRKIISSTYRHQEMRDHVLSVLASHALGDDRFTFLQSKSNLILHHLSTQTLTEKVSMRPLTRFSFMPGSLYQEFFYPLLAEGKPALYVDATEINRKDIYILTTDDQQQLISPIRFNLKVPTGCKAMNPSLIDLTTTTGVTNPQREWSFTLFCEKDKKWYLHFVPLK